MKSEFEETICEPLNEIIRQLGYEIINDDYLYDEYLNDLGDNF